MKVTTSKVRIDITQRVDLEDLIGERIIVDNFRISRMVTSLTIEYRHQSHRGGWYAKSIGGRGSIVKKDGTPGKAVGLLYLTPDSSVPRIAELIAEHLPKVAVDVKVGEEVLA